MGTDKGGLDTRRLAITTQKRQLEIPIWVFNLKVERGQELGGWGVTMGEMERERIQGQRREDGGTEGRTRARDKDKETETHRDRRKMEREKQKQSTGCPVPPLPLPATTHTHLHTCMSPHPPHSYVLTHSCSGLGDLGSSPVSALEMLCDLAGHLAALSLWSP